LKIIYHCYGGNHSSVTAAAVHLEKLPHNRLPAVNELMSLELFDSQDRHDIGRIINMGTDGWGNEIFVVGRLSRPTILYNMLHGLGEQFQLPADSYMLVDVGILINNIMRIGGLLSRGFGLTVIGRPLVARGTLGAYKEICQLVSEIKYGLQNGREFAICEKYVRYPEAAH
jgi:hypothetical protein